MPTSPDQPPAFSFHSAPTPQLARQIIGDRVRTARMVANLTQQELAGTTYSKSYISAIERGKMTPSLPALGSLAERLGVSLGYLLGEEKSQSSIEAPEVPTNNGERAAKVREAEQVLLEGRYEEALALFEHMGEPERANQTREAYAQFLAEQGRYQEAYEQMRLAQATTGRATNAL